MEEKLILSLQGNRKVIVAVQVWTATHCSNWSFHMDIAFVFTMLHLDSVGLWTAESSVIQKSGSLDSIGWVVTSKRRKKNEWNATFEHQMGWCSGMVCDWVEENIKVRAGQAFHTQRSRFSPHSPATDFTGWSRLSCASLWMCTHALPGAIISFDFTLIMSMGSKWQHNIWQAQGWSLWSGAECVCVWELCCERLSLLPRLQWIRSRGRLHPPGLKVWLLTPCMTMWT